MAGFDVRSLEAPVIVAPMAGGPSTPELAAAGSNAGGLGFLAAGYLTADAFAERITAARGLTTGPLGANLFVPQPERRPARRDRPVRRELLADEPSATAFSSASPRFDDDDWAAKLDVVHGPPARGGVVHVRRCPSADECARLRGAGITTVATVTTLAEARAGGRARRRRARRAGSRRPVDTAAPSTPPRRPPTQPLDQLLHATTVGLDVPVIAAGGLMTAVDVADVLASGAVAAQLGTAFLLADEAGSSPVHRAALADPQFTETAVTRCFSGRYARGLRNRFIDEHDAEAPLGYPEVHYLTSPVRAASVRAGDPHATNVWAGTGLPQGQGGSGRRHHRARWSSPRPSRVRRCATSAVLERFAPSPVRGGRAVAASLVSGTRTRSRSRRMRVDQIGPGRRAARAMTSPSRVIGVDGARCGSAKSTVTSPSTELATERLADRDRLAGNDIAVPGGDVDAAGRCR